jgi:hypothetical protein
MDDDQYPEQQQAYVSLRALVALVEKLDHIHDDVAAIRTQLGIPRPECYPRPEPNDEEER